MPIRILYGKDNKYTYHAGGAIVWDSTAEDEWEETLVKTKFLQTDFQLIETAVDDWARHVKRMKKSAEDLGFVWNEDIERLTLPLREGRNLRFRGGVISPFKTQTQFPTSCNDMASTSQKLRLTLDKQGNVQVRLTSSPNPLPQGVWVRIQGKVNSHNPFLYHKTTIRDVMPTDVFEHIRTNERGEITEGIFTNVAIEKNGKLYTPPVSCGLLNGTYRQKLLEEGKLIEKVLYPEDLQSADKIFCFNSVRKMVEVQLCL